MARVPNVPPNNATKKMDSQSFLEKLLITDKYFMLNGVRSIATKLLSIKTTTGTCRLYNEGVSNTPSIPHNEAESITARIEYFFIKFYNLNYKYNKIHKLIH